MWPLFHEFLNDTNIRNTFDSWMFGNYLLASPVAGWTGAGIRLHSEGTRTRCPNGRLGLAPWRSSRSFDCSGAATRIWAATGARGSSCIRSMGG
ncbi:uncharacterized protein STAUR_7706 [Stigmatella aurantiaca DW4/3-1]|uniref:6-a-glucosyltransferase n=1 Tax=Stigmatella aurantiaca (strain DW4/3-1) TaxID=378806 RepID=Q098Z1_STIAD|nr:uncharacterized protein STAUR_7706 [Stigmatella aurantiaca DW4/3-1]EAU68307.1 6-a-glucosyltransferase [Stigmatella aurantiaca DW4/3-1]